jgi:hypothetical protein
VGLKVEGVSARSFEVQFRCVATRTFLQEGQAGLDPEEKEPDVVFDDAQPEGSSAMPIPRLVPPLSGEELLGTSVWIPHLITPQAAAVGTLCVLVLLLMAVTGGVLVGRKSSLIAGQSAKTAPAAPTGGSAAEEGLTTPPARPAPPATNSTTSAGTTLPKTRRRLEGRSARNGNHPQLVPPPLSPDQGHTPPLGESISSKGQVTLSPNNSKPLPLQARLVANLKVQWQLQSVAGNAPAIDRVVRYVGDDPILETVLMRRIGSGLGVRVETVANSDTSPVEYIIEWTVYPIKSDLNATVGARVVAAIRDTQWDRTYQESFVVEEGNQEHAYAQAVQQILSRWSDIINPHPDQNPRRETALPVEPKVRESHAKGAVATKEEVTVPASSTAGQCAMD